MPIAAVTVTYNSADVLADFLASVYAQEGDWRLYIIDNNSDDGTKELLAAITDSRVSTIYNDANVGFAKATNQGIGLGLRERASDILLINNDTVFEKDVFVRLSCSLNKNDVDAISPLIVFEDAPVKVWYVGGHIRWTLGVRNPHDDYGQIVRNDYPALIDTKFCPACCMVFKQSVFERIGLLDEDYFVYVEDVDYSVRMNRARMTIAVDPSIKILHKASYLTGGAQSEFSVYQIEKNQMILHRKLTNPLYVAYGAAMAILLAGYRALRGHTTWDNARLRVRAVCKGMTVRLHPAPRLTRHDIER